MTDQATLKVPLARLVQYTARNCYKELLKLVENCVEEESGAAKIMLYEFLLSERYRFTRLFVLLKWYARYGRADEFCDEKIAESRNLLASYESSADGLWAVHNKLADACLPLIPVQSATEILATGGYARLPSIIYRNFVNKEFLLGLDGAQAFKNHMQDSEWMGLVSRTLLQSCISKDGDLRIFHWKTEEKEQAVEVGNTRGGWSLVLIAATAGDHCTWKLLQVRIYIKSAPHGVSTGRKCEQVVQSVLSKEQESYLRGICQQIIDQYCSSEDSTTSISRAISESGKLLEEKICIPLAMDILRLQTLKLSKNPLSLFKIQKDMDAVSLKFWEDPLSHSTEIRISPFRHGEEKNREAQNGLQQIVEYRNGYSVLVVRRWPFCVYMSLLDSKHKPDVSKESLLRQVIVNNKSTKLISKTMSEPLLNFSVERISADSIVFQLLSFKCRFLLEKLVEKLTREETLYLDSNQISLEYEYVPIMEGLEEEENVVKVAYLLVSVVGNIVIRIHVSLISGRLCCYTYDGYAWLKDKRCSTGYKEFSPVDYTGIVQFIMDHQKCIVRTCTYCQAKTVSLVIKEENFAPRLTNEKLTNAMWDKYGMICYADLDTCIALSPISWFGASESKTSSRTEGYQFYCDTLIPYNLFFVYHKNLHSEWLITHSLNASLGSRWLAIIETRKRQRELDTVLEMAPLDTSFQEPSFVESNGRDNFQNGFSYTVEENSIRNIQVIRPLSIPIEKGVFYTNGFGVRRVWLQFSFEFLDESYGLSYQRLTHRFPNMPWPHVQGIRLWHFGGQNLKASLILTYAHGHICLRRLTGDILIAQNMSKMIRRISAYDSQHMELVWKNWRELVVVNRHQHVVSSLSSRGLMRSLPPVYIRVDLRRNQNSRLAMFQKADGRTNTENMNNRLVSTDAKFQRQKILSQTLEQELPIPTIDILPMKPHTRNLCELVEELLNYSWNHVHRYMDVLLDHICFMIGCLLLFDERYYSLIWSSLFQLEISLFVGKEEDRLIFCAIELCCDESLESVRFKNLGYRTKSINMKTTNTPPNKANGDGGRNPVRYSQPSILWRILRHVASTSKDELSITFPNDDEILLKKQELPIVLERTVQLQQNNYNKSASNISRGR